MKSVRRGGGVCEARAGSRVDEATGTSAAKNARTQTCRFSQTLRTAVHMPGEFRIDRD